VTRVVLVAGTTRTAAIPGLSAAGSDADALTHTPSADAELVAYGTTVRAPEMPVSPTGCPTPALVTRAVRDLTGFDFLAVDGGLAVDTAAPTAAVGAAPGCDIREADPVPSAPGAFVAARRLGAALPDRTLVVGETVPGGTTTAMAVLRALGETWPVSSSLPTNPIERKERVVAEALAASDLAPGDAVGDPLLAVRRVGDPVLATVAGLVAGALGSGTRVVLGGGTQLVAATALVRHLGGAEPMTLATTPYLVDDVDLSAAADALALDVVVTDPGFADAPAPLSRFAAGEAKEGACMGGALWLADRAGVCDVVATQTLELLDSEGR
jgi:uncharacterized protein (TIGR00303 family)